jgi:diacylglycerol kinase (ATP)
VRAPAEILKRLTRAARNTGHGLIAAARTEPALREELAALAAALPVGVFIAPGLGWYVAMIGVLFVVLAVELLNTAIEKLCDHVTPELHPQIGLIKDIGSAAVFCTLCLAALIWAAAVSVRLGWAAG